MSLFALASGTLIADPQKRAGANGKPFTTATLRTPTDGEEGAVLVSLICFDVDAQAVLAGLSKGDAISVTGRAALKSWTGKDGDLRHGLSLVADRVMTAYQVRKARGSAASREASR